MLKQTFATLGLLFAAHAAHAAPNCALTIEGNDQLKYNITEMKVPAGCAEVEITLKHVGKFPVNAMGHNWVLAKTADAQAIASAGIAAGLDKDYLAPDDKRVIAHTKMVGGGQSATVKVSLKGLTKGGDYTFFCSFPGHYTTMHGKFVY